MFVYCPKCGLIEKSNQEQNPCPVCSEEQRFVPKKYLTVSGNMFISQQERSAFIQDVIVSNPAYDKELASQRDHILQEKALQHSREVAQKVKEYKAQQTTCRCPVCGSTNLSAISTVGKVVKISVLGVWGAGDLGKKRYCNSCGHKF